MHNKEDNGGKDEAEWEEEGNGDNYYKGGGEKGLKLR